MPQKESNRLSGLVSAAIFIMLEVAAFAMLSNSSTLQNIWINRLSHRALAATWGTGERIRSYFSLDRQNEDLVLENRALRDELERYRLMGISISDSLGTKVVRKFKYTPARIVKMSRNTQHNYIILDKGSRDGIRPQCGIMMDNCVVGIVDAVDEHYSYGLTLMNRNVNVSARLGREGHSCTLSWDGIHTDRAVINGLPTHYDVQPGDTVWTSGYSSIFPPDIPLGTAENSYMIGGSVRAADVALFQDFSAIRHVTVVENLSISEITALERKEGKE